MPTAAPEYALRKISDVAMDAVFQSPGSAMESLIVRIRRMKERRAMAPTHVMNRSSSVETTNAFLLSGDVTEKMIARMVQMKQVVQLECAMKPNSAVMMADV